METSVRLRQARLALLWVFLVHGAVFALLVTRIPAVQDRYGLGDTTLPLFLAAVPVLAGAGSVTVARVVRRFPAPVLVRVLQPAVCLLPAGIGAGDTWWHLALCLAAFGLLVGALEASLNMTGVAVQRRYARSVMLGFHGAMSLGGILGALLAGAGARLHLSLFVLFAGAAVPLLVITVAAGSRLGPGTAYGSGGAGDLGGDGGGEAGRAGRRGGVPWRPLLPLCLVMGAAFVADSTSSNWSAKFLEDTLHSSDAMATVPYALYMATTLLGRGLGDAWVRRWGAAAVVRAGALLGTAGFAAVAAAPGPWAAAAGFAVLGAGLSVIVPQVFTAAAQRLPGATDTAVARINLFNYVGFLVGPPLVGAVGAAVSYRAAMCVPLLLLLGVLLAARSLTPAPTPSPSGAPADHASQPETARAGTV